MFLAFQLFGPAHLSVLALTLALPLGLAWLARNSEPRQRLFARFLIALLLLDRVAALAAALHTGTLTWSNGLPMQLCDWALVACVIALANRAQTAFDLAYFWGFSGTLQALLTPDTSVDFADARTWIFFGEHSGVLSSVLFLIFAFRLRISLRSLGRAWAWSQVYLACAVLVNWALGANYGYLCRKPVHASLFDWLGPWPLYLGSLELLAVVFYGFYFLLFFLGERWLRRDIAVAPRAGGV